MMTSKIGFIFTLTTLCLSAAAHATCADVGLSGTWTDARDRVFSISQDKCNVLLNDQGSNALYTIPLDGSAATIPYSFYAIQEANRNSRIPEMKLTASALADKSVAMKVSAINFLPKSFTPYFDESVMVDASATVTAKIVKVPNVVKFSYYPQSGVDCSSGYVKSANNESRCDKYLVMNSDNTAPKEIQMLKLVASNLSIKSKIGSGLTSQILSKLLSFTRGILIPWSNSTAFANTLLTPHG